MNILAIDIGNTRSKWKLFGGRAAAGVFAGALPTGGELKAVAIGVDLVACGSVRNAGFNDSLAMICERSIQKKPVFLRAHGEFGALKNGYEIPEKLGVDRWLALVAAWGRIPGELIVVDLGTAVTIDVVNASGQHQGGYIVPGLQTLVDSLNKGTGLIDVRAVSAADGLVLGVNTAAAVVDGCAKMLVSFVLAESDKHPGAKLFITGGGADALIEYFPDRAYHLPDLVLEGIFLTAEAELQ